MFSMTTTESSMISPMAIASPPSDIRFSVPPNIFRKKNEKNQYGQHRADYDGVTHASNRLRYEFREIVDDGNMQSFRNGRTKICNLILNLLGKLENVPTDLPGNIDQRRGLAVARNHRQVVRHTIADIGKIANANRSSAVDSHDRIAN